MTESRHGAGLDPRGALLVVAGGVCLSFGGLLVRLIDEADGWQILFYRGLGFVPTLLLFVVWRHGRATADAFRAIGWSGAAVALCMSAGFVAYVFAVLHTTVANVVFTIAAGPFIAALLGWLVLREWVAGVTWIAMGVALFGVALMVGEGHLAGRLFGQIIAFVVPLSFAILVVIIRRWPQRDILPAVCLAGAIPMAVGAFMAGGDLQVPLQDALLAILMGSLQVGLGFVLITLGTRTVPAAQVALLGLGETVLAPIWVWIFLAEQPSLLTLGGGFLVLGAVAGQALLLIKRRRSVDMLHCSD